MATQQNVIKAFMATLGTTSLEGSAAVDSAVKSCSNFNDMNDVIDKMVSDCKSYISADSQNGWKNFLLEKCGINLSNTDTGAITGKDAGGSKVKTAESIIPGSGSVNKNFTDNSFPQNGNGNDTLSGGAGNDSLWGGVGKDTFIYKPGEATDKIMDYSFNEGDMLTILKSNGKSGGSFTDSKFSGSELTLTISGGGTIIFKSVRTGDKFNINNKTYTISGSKLK